MSTPSYSADNQWAQAFAKQGMSYPAEYVIRIFRGHYPHLSMPKPQSGQSILDVGCGDGRHLPFFNSLGLNAYGVEIAQELVDQLRNRLVPLGVPENRVDLGSCAKLPHPDASFDYVIAWNSSYYMSLDDADFAAHASELLRVLRPGGWLIISVPKQSSFIFEESWPHTTPGYRVIGKDPYGVRVGEVMRVFASTEELKGEFEGGCDTFCYADIHDDCFGFAYHWHLLVARKNSVAPATKY